MTARPESVAIWPHISDVNYPSIRCCITSSATRESTYRAKVEL